MFLLKDLYLLFVRQRFDCKEVCGFDLAIILVCLNFQMLFLSIINLVIFHLYNTKLVKHFWLCAKTYFKSPNWSANKPATLGWLALALAVPIIPIPKYLKGVQKD